MGDSSQCVYSSCWFRIVTTVCSLLAGARGIPQGHPSPLAVPPVNTATTPLPCPA
jgi:hypothetical protein